MLPDARRELRFARQRAFAEVYLCFECRILMSEGKMNSNAWANFDPAAAKLIAVIKRVFPADAGIQSLR
jgi:hypothetical protein